MARNECQHCKTTKNVKRGWCDRCWLAYAELNQKGITLDEAIAWADAIIAHNREWNATRATP